jgi:hypothetical protein
MVNTIDADLDGLQWVGFLETILSTLLVAVCTLKRVTGLSIAWHIEDYGA